MDNDYKQIEDKNIQFHNLIINLPPFGFFDYIHLQKNLSSL